MDPITETFNVNAGDTVTRTLEVPSGPDRIFTATAFDVTGTELYQGRSEPVNLEADVPTSVIIQMQPLIVTVTVTQSGAGSGTVTSDPAGIDCGTTCAAVFNIGTVVTLTAAPDAGSVFSGWNGEGCTGAGSCAVTMDADKSVTAAFVRAPVQTFSLSITVTGSGAVTSSPAGISCGLDCTEVYATGTVVTLTATPSFGSTFT
ncbi:MAG: hypothetical protein AABY46_08405, partial [Nitrospirota bacterium]